MAKVSNNVAVTTNKPVARGSHSDLYPSLNSLRSTQQQEDRESYGEWFRAGLRHIFNFTIASCFSCFPFMTRPKRQHDTEELLISMDDGDEIQAMKEELNFHFMNPFQKWKNPNRRRFPWKLVIQLISIILVTIQLVIFAGAKSALTTFIEENQATFTKLFVHNPPNPNIDIDDPLPSPITTLYTHDDLKYQINHTVHQFFHLESLALGNYGYGWGEPPTITMLIEKYNESIIIDPALKNYIVKSKETHNEKIVFYNETFSEQVFNWTKTISELSQTLHFTLQFDITSIFVRFDVPQCFQFHVKFLIRNNLFSGNMPVDLTVQPDISLCDNDTSNTQRGANGIPANIGVTVLDGAVIVFALISILQCVRSIITSGKLSRRVGAFFRSRFDYRLKFHQILPLYNKWFLLVIASNLLVILGCILKILIAYGLISNLELVDITSIIIGVAVFGQYCGLLRFLSYFDKYNILLITLRLSIPSVIRFIICTGILYMAFLLCGWLVLGPYHPKFRDPYVTSECLFSLVNGDDMFATYKGMSTSSTAAYIFSKVYLYIFIGLFIYVVLSVFISLISDTYETLHEHWYERTKGLLMDFASGKLGQVNYHEPVPRGRTVSHTDLDPSEVEDYEYIREASNRYGPSITEEQPFILNGGPELRNSPINRISGTDSSSSPSINRRGIDLRAIPHIQIRGFGQGRN